MSSADTFPCEGGYVCTGGSKVAAPTSDGGKICPKGHYCESGAMHEV